MSATDEQTPAPDAMFEVPYSQLQQMTGNIERLTAQLQAAQATIAEARAVVGRSWESIAEKVQSILSRADMSALAEHDRQTAAKAWWEGAEDERLNGSPLNPYRAASIEQEGAE